MRDILPDLDRWRSEKKRIAIATVVQTWGSAPRHAGSKLAVASNGQFSGSVSGGCVENAVIEAALDAIDTDRPRLLHFGIADETAWEVGLACGGSLDVFVKPLDDSFFDLLRAAWIGESNAVLATVIRGPDEMLGREMLIHEDGTVIGSIGDALNQKALQFSDQILAGQESRRVVIDENTELFLERISPPPTLVAVGGVHVTLALISLAKILSYRTVVIDPRKLWGNEERFRGVDQLIQAWPEEALQQITITDSTAIAVLTHDPKLDDAALKIALNSPAFYIGALGSRKTNANRRQRLLEAGLTENQLSRLHVPIGIDIHAKTPEEISLAILSEVVSVYRQGKKLPLTAEADLPILPH